MVLCKERILGFMEEEEIATNNNKKELIREFKSAMECILDYLDGKVFDTSHVKVLMLKGAFDWNKIYSMIKRERRRLHDGLPIYAHRTNILRQIHCHQVMVLTTGSGGKSTRLLVQFLADSGVAGDKSIVCTQPRKLSAMSFAANRVDNQKVIYMTDHCLLEHYMNDNNFSWASCIIVNQAHETSLNTDLLLALMKQLLNRRSDLRLIIMSAAADSQELSEYFFGCPVLGTTTPADTTHLPEIHKVGLRIALLRILALGIHTIDFIHAPCNESIETAIKHLVQLGAIVLENDAHKLTRDGWILAKLGIEPRFGKMALKCFENGLGREGLVLAAVMANSGCIFYKGENGNVLPMTTGVNGVGIIALIQNL